MTTAISNSGWSSLPCAKSSIRPRLVRPATTFAAILTGVLAFIHPAAAQTDPDARRCRDLRGIAVDKGRVLATSFEKAGDFRSPDGTARKDLPAFCRVTIVSSGEPGSRIVSELWLPLTAGWNGKLLGTGNGGFGGAIRYGVLAGGLKRGYAVANTDMGTVPASSAKIWYDAGNGQPAMIRDWGYRATHLMTLSAKTLVQRFYGKAQQRAYFYGCSTGGHQGLAEAQRYPRDYDGIIAGAPGNNRTHLHIAFNYNFQITQATAERQLMASKAALFRTLTLKDCGGKDGGAPGEKFLNAPTSCKADPAALLCKPGQSPDLCLTPGEVRSLRSVFDGARNLRTGELIYFPYLRGSEGQIASLLGDPSSDRARAPGDLASWMADGLYASDRFDFDRDVDRLDARFGPEINALDPDLSAYAARGGKLLLYHGWEDGVVSPLDTVAYFEAIRSGATARDAFARLYMVPGMQHCLGGEAPRPLTLEDMPSDSQPDDELLAVLDRWVDGGKAPGALSAFSFTDGKIAATRPLCPYPAVPAYVTPGDPAKAASFVCRAVAPLLFERPPARYLYGGPKPFKGKD
jgi:feruloyl esterase